MNIRKIWESNISIILLLWIIISLVSRPGWGNFFIGVLIWIVLIYITTPGVFWNYLSLFIPHPVLTQKLLMKAVSYKPLISSPYILLGLNFARNQNWDQAVPLLEKAVEYASQRKRYQCLIWLGESYRANGAIEKALSIFEDLEKKGLATMAVYMNLALINLQLKHFPEALEYTKKARAGNLSATEPVLIQAKTYFSMGDYQQAKNDYQWVIEHLKWPVESFYWLGRAELELHETETAITHLQKAVERISEDPLLSDISKAEAEEWLNKALDARQG